MAKPRFWPANSYGDRAPLRCILLGVNMRGQDSLLNLELQSLPGQQGLISGEADSETVIILPITTVLQASRVDKPVHTYCSREQENFFLTNLKIPEPDTKMSFAKNRMNMVYRKVLKR
jgi:hypothetical protein